MIHPKIRGPRYHNTNTQYNERVLHGGRGTAVPTQSGARVRDGVALLDGQERQEADNPLEGEELPALGGVPHEALRGPQQAPQQDLQRRE